MITSDGVSARSASRAPMKLPANRPTPRAPAATARVLVGEPGDLGQRERDVGEAAEHAAEAEHGHHPRRPTPAAGGTRSGSVRSPVVVDAGVGGTSRRMPTSAMTPMIVIAQERGTPAELLAEQGARRHAQHVRHGQPV